MYGGDLTGNSMKYGSYGGSIWIVILVVAVCDHRGFIGTAHVVKELQYENIFPVGVHIPPFHS